MWKKYTINDNSIYNWRNGFVEYWVQKKGKEWLIAHKLSDQLLADNIIAGIEEKVPEAEWKSFIVDKNSNLNITPAFPDRSLVVKPTQSFRLMPKMSIQLFIHVPYYIQMYAGTAKSENLICEIPGNQLSNTWFGESDNGTLCYALPNALTTQLEKNKLTNHEILCPLKVINESSAPLDFQRFSLHVEYLNIYLEDGLMYSNDVKVKFKGESNISDIHYSQSAPSFLENAKQISSARNPEKGNVISKSFHFIKSLTNY